MAVIIMIFVALMFLYDVEGQVYRLPESREVCQNSESATLKFFLEINL